VTDPQALERTRPEPEQERAALAFADSFRKTAMKARAKKAKK
jgi:hypothetical protein